MRASRGWYKIAITGVAFTAYRKFKRLTEDAVFTDSINENESSFTRNRRALSLLRQAAETRIDPLIEGLYRSIDLVVKRKQGHLLPSQKSMNYPYDVPTVVFDLEGIIGKSVYSPMSGWDFVPFPGAETAIDALSKHYELLCWSRQLHPFVLSQPLVSKFPLVGVLHRNDCVAHGSAWSRPIERLGRDLSRVVVLEVAPDLIGQKVRGQELEETKDPRTIELPPHGEGLPALTYFLNNIAKTHESLQRKGASLDFPTAIESKMLEVDHDIMKFGRAVVSLDQRKDTVSSILSWLGVDFGMGRKIKKD